MPSFEWAAIFVRRVLSSEFPVGPRRPRLLIVKRQGGSVRKSWLISVRVFPVLLPNLSCGGHAPQLEDSQADALDFTRPSNCIPSLEFHTCIILGKHNNSMGY
jgi:hypothetical protein